MLVPAVAKLSNDDSHRVMEPECPLKVKVVAFVPEQTVAAPATDPPVDTGEMVTEAVEL